LNDPLLTIVTGAPGWLGTRLTRVLSKGLPDEPRLATPRSRCLRLLVLPGLDASFTSELDQPVEIVAGDLTDRDAVQRLCEGAAGATIFHCAGVIHPTRGIKQLFQVNHQGTRNLVEAAERAGVRRLVCVSSNSPFGCNARPEERFDESAAYQPYRAYGRSKKLMEQAVRECEARGRLETVVIRPPWFYGPDQPPRQTEFFTMIRRGRAPIVGGGLNRRSMAYVDNICHGLLLCEEVEQARGQTYWIADAEPYTMNRIIDTVERLLEDEFNLSVAHKRLRLPGIASGIAGFCDTLIQAAGVYHTKIHVLSEMNKTIACTIDKARQELGYEPRIALEEGMRRSITWCLEKGHKI